LILGGDLCIFDFEGLLGVSLLFNQVALLEGEGAESFIEGLVTVDDGVAGETDNDLTDSEDGSMADV